MLGGGQWTQRPRGPAEKVYQPKNHRLGSVGVEEPLDQLMYFGKRIPFTRGAGLLGIRKSWRQRRQVRCFLDSLGAGCAGEAPTGAMQRRAAPRRQHASPCLFPVLHFVQVAEVLWWYYFSKLIEFLDTIFFVLRKKTSQITFLHVYHHASMFNIWWCVLNWIPCGQSK